MAVLRYCVLHICLMPGADVLIMLNKLGLLDFMVSGIKNVLVGGHVTGNIIKLGFSTFLTAFTHVPDCNQSFIINIAMFSISFQRQFIFYCQCHCLDVKLQYFV
jgi:hypothetical protein